MDTFATIVLALGVLVVPMLCAYIVMERLARRRNKSPKEKTAGKVSG